MAAYVPKQGDLVALDFDPQSGHEQQGRRPALVLSKDAFNKGTGMAICCPITNTDRRVPFHVRGGRSVHGWNHFTCSGEIWREKESRNCCKSTKKSGHCWPLSWSWRLRSHCAHLTE